MATQKPTIDPQILEVYQIFKNLYPKAIILIYVNHFYETIGPDAETLRKVLDSIVVETVPAEGFCSKTGFPEHRIQCSLTKLINAGHEVAIGQPVN